MHIIYRQEGYDVAREKTGNDNYLIDIQLLKLFISTFLTSISLWFLGILMHAGEIRSDLTYTYAG